jgi:hypothetical protein
VKWTPYDKNQVTNLIIALKKAKFEMTGMEVVAFADVFKWVSFLHDHIEESLKPSPPLSPAAVSEPKTLEAKPASEEPKKRRSKADGS